MAKKQDAFYFDTFTACLDDACKAAQLLDRSMREFDPDQIKETLDEMHNIEHAADDKKHELLNVLAKAFITPIEREDIILLSQNIDEVTDKIEDVLLRIYCNNVQKIRPEALELSRLVIRCCEEAKLMRRSSPTLSDPRACGTTSSVSTLWRRRPTSSLSTACVLSTPPAWTPSRSSFGGRSSSIWRSVWTPVNMCRYSGECGHEELLT